MLTCNFFFVILGLLILTQFERGFASTRSMCVSESPTTEETTIAVATATAPSLTEVPTAGENEFFASTIMTEPPERRVAITVHGVTTSLANLTVYDDVGSATLVDIEAECHSDVFQACDSVTYQDNLVPSDPGYLEVSGLQSGTAYDITVVSATHGGNSDTSLDSTVRFCTKPKVNFVVSKLSDTSVQIVGTVEGGNFHSATATFSPSDSCSVTFTPLMLPLQVTGLTSGTTYEITFESRVSAASCGAGGSQSSEMQVVEYQPDLYAAVSVSVAEKDDSGAKLWVEGVNRNSRHVFENIVTACASPNHGNCAGARIQPNRRPESPGSVVLSQLHSGSSYTVTVEQSTFDGAENTLHNTAVTFCTKPAVGRDQVHISHLGDNVYRATVDSEVDFDDVIVSMIPNIYTTRRFQKGEEPEVDISDLPAGDYQLEAMFRVGIHRDCGSAGNGDAAVETSAVYYTYKHRSMAPKIFPGFVVLMVTLTWTTTQ